MTNLISIIDEYLLLHNRQAIGAVEANALLARSGVLIDSEERPGLPLRKLLRGGKFPHAYQLGSKWVIPISKQVPNDPSKQLSLERYVDELPFCNTSTLRKPLVSELCIDTHSGTSIDQVDFSNLDSLRQAGFLGFRTVAELLSDKSSLPKVKGIYLVLKPTFDVPDFVEVGCGGHFKGKNPNVAVSFLKTNWVDEASVLYVGKAGYDGGRATLYSRLSQYLRFGQGKNVGHWGGRLIWQLSNCQDLIVCWKPLPADNPRTIEKQLIVRFVSLFGKRPFANLVN